ncbi:hypothetical protein [uncultured Clostridium sp.]|uniref:DUF6906 family protein n=1 Tax=uncultured Clostridium sp. TaxID=59620 RepID=UPI0026729122|nr:hypothetical protein [uncultured Clostridium sp.]
MLLNKLIELHGELTYKEYELLLKVVRDDIEFGKALGIEYTDTKILNVINNTVNLIINLDISQSKKLTREQKKFLINEGLDPREFLIERETPESYVFYNINTKVLWNFRR